MKRIARGIVRRLYRGLVPPNAKRTLRQWLMFDAPDHPPEVIDRFEERSVVVLAPHQDDEAVGCGGTIRRHVAAGATVTIVFLTDGRRGDPTLYERGLDAAAISAAEDELVETRKTESRRAGEILGASELVFLGGPDGALDATPEIVRDLGAVLDRTRPEVVYVPSVFDNHPDHWASNRILDACLTSSGATPVIRGYEAWTPLIINRVVCIDDVVEDKRRALAVFESQLPHLDVVNGSIGLAQYRAIHGGARRGYAEAFHETTPGEHHELVARCAAKR